MSKFIPVKTRNEAVELATQHLENSASLRGGNLYILPDGQKLRVRKKERGRLSAENYGTKSKADAARAEAEQVPAYVERLFEQYGSPERFEEFVNWVKEGNKQQKQRTPAGFNVGHIGALSKGKPNVPTNRRLESAAENQRRGDKAEPSDEALLVTGVPRTWEEAVINFLDPSGLPTELTPQDTQRIRAGEDPQLIFEQRSQRMNKARQALGTAENMQATFEQGKTGSMVTQAVEEVARTLKPTIGGVQITGEADPETDVGKQMGDAILNELEYVGNQLRNFKMPYRRFGGSYTPMKDR